MAEETSLPDGYTLCIQEKIPVQSGTKQALLPQYLVFHKVVGFPLWPAWIIPEHAFGAFAAEGAFRVPDVRKRILENKMYAIRCIDVNEKAQKCFGADDKNVLDWVDVEPHLTSLRMYGRTPTGSAADNTLHPYFVKHKDKLESFQRSIDIAVKIREYLVSVAPPAVVPQLPAGGSQGCNDGADCESIDDDIVLRKGTSEDAGITIRPGSVIQYYALGFAASDESRMEMTVKAVTPRGKARCITLQEGTRLKPSDIVYVKKPDGSFTHRLLLSQCKLNGLTMEEEARKKADSAKEKSPRKIAASESKPSQARVSMPLDAASPLAVGFPREDSGPKPAPGAPKDVVDNNRRAKAATKKRPAPAKSTHSSDENEESSSSAEEESDYEPRAPRKAARSR